MSLFNPKVFALCVALAIGPPMVMVGIHYDQWFARRPIDPRVATGEVLFFEANWCGACRSMKPVVDELRGEGFAIRTLDVDTHRERAMKYGIHAIPAFVLLRDGQEVRRAAGVISPESLRQLWR